MTHDPFVWVNGLRLSSGAMHVSATDRGFTLADGLFETIRISNGVAFRLGAHLGRMHASALRFGLPLPVGLPRAIEDAVRVAAEAGLVEAGLRLTVTRGSGPPGLTPPASAAPSWVITIAERVRAPEEPGLVARIASGRRNEYAISAGMKTLSYTDSVLALAEARSFGADEALLLDTEGHLSSGSASNLFLVLGEKLHTPPLSCAALPGITRAAVIELADALGILVDERPLALDDVEKAGEVFLTSSLRGIAPVHAVDARAIGRGNTGPVTRTLMERYQALVQMECGAWPSVGA